MNKLTQKITIFTSALLLTTTMTSLAYNTDASFKANLHNEIYSQELATDNNIENQYYNISANIENIVALPDTIKTGVVTSNGSLNMRKGASTKYAVVQKLKKGETVTILESKSGWYKVKSSNGKTGWVSSKYIKVNTTKNTTKNTIKNTSSSTSNTPTSNATVAISTSNKNATSNVVVSPNSSTSNTTNSTSTNSEKNIIINNLLTTEGNITSAEINAIKNNLNKLPLNLLKAVKDSGLKVLLTTKDVKTYYNSSFSGTMTGLFDPMVGKIYISSNVSHINKSTVHEFGHALDLLVGKSNYVSLSKEWNDIYKAESNTASGSYYKSNAQEYFADAFDRYIANPSALKSSAPKTYAYIHSAIKNL